MTHRHRVLDALDHRSTDRCPIDFGGHRSSGINAVAYSNLRRFLELPPKPIRVYDVIQQLAIIDEDVLDRFDVDTIELGRAFASGPEHWTDWTLPDGTPCTVPVWTKPQPHQLGWALHSATGRILGTMSPFIPYFQQSYYPFLTHDDLNSLESALNECLWTALRPPPGPLASGASGRASLAQAAASLRQRSDRAIIALFGGSLLELGQSLYGIEPFLLLLAADPKRAHRFLDCALELHLRHLERFLAAVGPYIDILQFGDDLGMQTGPQISPAMYREFFKSRHRLLWQRAKQLSQARIMLHSCGGIRELLPDLIDAGIQALNPVQINCHGMDPAILKQRFGHLITFWGGGCDPHDPFTHATPPQIAQRVNQLLQIWRPGGGYVFQHLHNFMPNIPPANIVAMFDTARTAP
jgi:uroporphyrinogen decarboxylase